MNLVIAEKNSVAKTISEVLGAKTKKDGYWEGNGYVVTHCIGHLVGQMMPEGYDEKWKQWNLSNLPIIPNEMKFVPNERTKKQLNVIKELLKRVDVQTVINACDAGREGEMICMELIEYFKCKKPVKRLWITSLEEKSIRDGFSNLRSAKDYENLYHSAICRTQADWLVGMNYTRLYTKLYNTDTQNIGRVMTPTLAMIVKRDSDIRNFVKVPFYVVKLTGGGFTADGKRQESKQVAEEISSLCNGKTAIIDSVEKKRRKKNPPQLYDLTSLQKDANDLFGYTAATTLETAQQLYEMKILTYPRTDSKYITEDMKEGIPKLIEAISKIMPYEVELITDLGAYPKTRLPVAISSPAYNGNSRIVKNAEVTDHHAILPTPTAATTNISALTKEQRDILHMVMTRLLCAVNEQHDFEETSVKVLCEGHEFTTKGTTIIKNGWRDMEIAFERFIGKQETKKENQLPELLRGQSFTAGTFVHEGTSEPPKHYTEATLLASMEKAGAEDMPDDAERKGVGTPATRAEIIEKLIKITFIERKKKNLLSTTKGQNLIAVLSDDDPIKEPKLTSEWETKLKNVEKGILTKEAFMEDVVKYVSATVSNNQTPTEEGTKLLPPKSGFLATKSSYSETEIIKPCPRCDGSVVDKPKSYGCTNSECKYFLLKDNKWFVSAKKKFTPSIAKSLLKDGKVLLKDCYSAKKDKKYDVILKLKDKGEGWLDFDFEFPKK